jgi:NAD(P)-dependent dehydrogenase (short-subunit alcohol dehydrogenase family)
VAGRLDGEVAVVTGSTSGLGATIARRFAAEGAAVLVTGRDQARGSAVVDAIAAKGGRVAFVTADLSDPESAAAEIITETVAALGPPTILVNNAVAHLDGASDGRVEDVTPAVWSAALTVDLLAPAALIAGCLRHMTAIGQGSIVNVSSRAASHGTPDHAVYSSAKGALESLTRSVAMDYSYAGIRCNAVRPGYVLHERRDAGLTRERFDEIAAAQLTPPVTADDVAAACLWLASSESAGVTGLVLPVDGGSTSARPTSVG